MSYSFVGDAKLNDLVVTGSGTIDTVSQNPKSLVNKEYVDQNSSGSTLQGTTNRIVVSNGTIDIDENYGGQDSIRRVGNLNIGSVDGSPSSSFKMNSVPLSLENLTGLASLGLTIPYHMGNTSTGSTTIVVPKPSTNEVGRLHYFINMDTTGGAAAGFNNKFVIFDFNSGGTKILNALGTLIGTMKLKPGNALVLVYLGEPAELNGLGLWGLTNSGATLSA